VNHRDNVQKTPLFYAIEVKAENLDVVLLLVNKGADVNAHSIDGWSPLLKAASMRHHQILENLLNKGANHSHILQTNSNSALHIACENADIESIKALVEAGADIQLMNKDKETPFMVAKRLVGSGKRQQEAYNYLKGVWADKEMKAQNAKDELVMQEEIIQEKERKKQ
jgi:ankyrin repeat protein